MQLFLSYGFFKMTNNFSTNKTQLNLPLAVSKNYRTEIDGLRAIAVIAVIANHFNSHVLPCGFLGVDIFFVISGYVITSSIASREYISFLDFLGGFYYRRIIRLAPSLVIFTIFTIAIFYLFADPYANTTLSATRTALSSLAGVSNIYLYKQSTNYFGLLAEINPFMHTWSLGVEEQFYLLFPFLIYFSGFRGNKANSSKIFLVLLILGHLEKRDFS